MNEMYNRIEALCAKEGITVTTMCREAQVSRGNLTDLKMGRQRSLNAKNTAKIASYFGVSVGYLLGEEEKAPAVSGERSISDDDLKFALWGDCDEIDDDDIADVKKYAAFVRERKKKK